MDGILIVYKPTGMTSFNVVSKVRRLCGVKRIGHAGTLDPMATGVLPLLIGKAAVMQEKLTDHDKRYRAGVRFGLTTDTGDVTGNVLQEKDVNITRADVENILPTFTGKLLQVPPMYSAIQIDGKRLYDLARKGVEVERKPREIEVFSASLVEKVTNTDYYIDIECSKGTYIRTLCEDMGKALGVGAALFSLERTRCGIYEKSDAVGLDELVSECEKDGVAAIESRLLPVEPLFSDLPKIRLAEFFTRLCLNGCEIYLDKAHIPEKTFDSSTFCRVYTFDGKFVGMGELCDYPDGKAVKMKYRFM